MTMGDTDLRALVESAYNEAEASGASDGESHESSDVAMGGAGVAEAPAGISATPGDDGGSESAQPKADRARDSSGKFAPKLKAQETLKPASSKTPAVAEGAIGGPPTTDGSQLSEVPAVVAEAIKAPQGLTPLEREVFAKAPPEIQKALGRLDQSARQALQDAAPARKFQQEVHQVLAPAEHLLRQRGLNPAQLIQSYVQVDQQLSSGNQAMMARAIGQLIRTYGLTEEGVKHLAAEIDGAPQQQQAPQHMDPQSIIRQAKEELRQEMQQSRQQSQVAKFSQEVSAFAADPKNEFMADESVQVLVASLLQSNPKLDLAAAYERAIWSDPETRDIMQKRANRDAEKARQASTQAARNAASSVKSAPSTGASSVRAPKTVREMVEASYDALDR